MTKGALIAVVGDTHANSALAICPPTFEMEHGTHRADKRQAFAWREWLAFWQWVEHEKVALNWPLYVVLNGDLGDDLQHATTQLITQNKASIHRLTMMVLEPALAAGDHFIVTRGTAAHVHLAGAFDELVAADIQGAIASQPQKNIYSWWRFRGEFAGVFVDIKHHPGTASRVPNTRGNEANRIAFGVSYAYNRHNCRAPDLAIRGHNHVPVDSYDNHQTRAIIHPSWQAPTEFVERLGFDDTPPIGGLLIYCEDRKYEVKKRYSEWPITDWRANYIHRG